jgi:hypothetical protein
LDSDIWGGEVRPITEIIIHCTATAHDWWADKPTSVKVAEIRRWHVQDRGWKDIGYHYLIDRDGTVANGRPLDQIGAHVKDHNTGTIGISLFGGHGSSSKDDFTDHFTIAQDKALRGLIASLHGRFGKVLVTGHNQYAAKACPGFTVADWLKDTALMNAIPVKPKDLQTPKSSPEALRPVEHKSKAPAIGAAIFALLAAVWAYFTK